MVDEDLALQREILPMAAGKLSTLDATWNSTLAQPSLGRFSRLTVEQTGLPRRQSTTNALPLFLL